MFNKGQQVKVIDDFNNIIIALLIKLNMINANKSKR